MESVHGIDVSWIHNTHSKDHPRHPKAQSTTSENTTPEQNGTKAPQISAKPISGSEVPPTKEVPSTPPAQATQKPAFTRRESSEKNLTPTKSGTPPPGNPRRNSWLSSLSSKFSSSPGAQNSHHNGSAPAAKQSTVQEDQTFRQPVWNPPRVAILPHGIKPEGAAPYIPAPVKTPQSNFLSSALRRLSSSSGGQLSGASKLPHYGLCERKILNVDTHRERSLIPELNQSKLRRVSFCVDVEIAGGPRYIEEEDEKRKDEKKQKKNMVDKGEGEALKHHIAIKEEKETDETAQATVEEPPKDPEPEVVEATPEDKSEATGDKDNSKKKEKKKRSEEERKARKEKKRRLAEANGMLPVELVMNGSDSSLAEDTPATLPGTPKTQASPTTDPARIYRRCCQLRESPILKRITEQLSSPVNCAIDKPGVVTKLDLSGYWLQLTDLITLADYLAIVPIKELVMENCGLTDEGVRVLLAGLLAAKYPDNMTKRKHRVDKDSLLVHQGGVVERVVFKNNPKISPDGWGHIALFIHMCRSVKYMDLSMIPFPQSAPVTNGTTTTRTASTSECFTKAISERLGGPDLELLNMAETGLSTVQLGMLIDAVNKSGMRRLGLAGNHITTEGMEHIGRYLKNGKCEGLDLGGIDLKDHLGIIAESLDENQPLWALSLANCALTPDSLALLFPVLVKLKNFRFIDLSHNHDLFVTTPSALSLFRRYLPKLKTLKRIHLNDVSMTSEQAVALAEILPEIPSLAHLSIMENPDLSALAHAKDEKQQEEACALYASLMAAVRVSKTLVCIDIDVPEAESSEIVKALAKQVVAYSLRNMERNTAADLADAASSISDPSSGEKEVAVPDVLLHLVGHMEGFSENHDDDEPAPDDDYVIGGTGVVKALGICLRNKMNDSRRPSTDRLNSEDVSGANTPKTVSGGKAKDMSKNLLGSARKIRARLQPALIKEANSGDRSAYNRLVFLDKTLERMIQRFEDEYPETRLPNPLMFPSIPGPNIQDIAPGTDAQGLDTEPPLPEPAGSDEEDATILPTLSRHNSDVSLASKALSQEEGRMLRFGQKFRRDILKPEQDDQMSAGSEHEVLAPHLEMLKSMIDGLGGDEIRRKVEEGGQEALLKELSEDASTLRQQIIDSDPDGWVRFREAMETAGKNAQTTHIVDTSASAIVD